MLTGFKLTKKNKLALKSQSFVYIYNPAAGIKCGYHHVFSQDLYYVPGAMLVSPGEENRL